MPKADIHGGLRDLRFTSEIEHFPSSQKRTLRLRIFAKIRLSTWENRLRGFHQGLKEVGYIEGENVTILYRWADDRLDRLPLLAAELVSRSVAAIVTSGQPSVLAAKAATTTIPIIFIVGTDPVQLGLAASLSRPGGNLTVDNFTVQIGAKRLEVLHDLLPKVHTPVSCSTPLVYSARPLFWSIDAIGRTNSNDAPSLPSDNALSLPP